MRDLNESRELRENAHVRRHTNAYFLRWLSAYSSGRFFFIHARTGQNTGCLLTLINPNDPDPLRRGESGRIRPSLSRNGPAASRSR